MNLKLFFASALFLIFASSSAQKVELDTIYYDKEWKGVSGPHFASYYRIIEKNPIDTIHKRLRDYYIDGSLQGEGEYITIDRTDDSKTTFNGKCINYYKSGAIAEQSTRVNGKYQGEYIRFYENGSIQLRVNMNDNQPHGLLTEFHEDGICVQQEFWFGKPKYDYYIISNDNGLYSRIRTSDNMPIFTSPSITDKKVSYYDGDAWPYYIHDGLLVSMNNSRINDYGKYYRVNLNITNNTFYPIEYDPSETIATLIDKNGKERVLEVQTAEQYDSRIKRTQRWEEALACVANGMAAASAGYSSSTTNTYYSGSSYSSGSASAYGSGGYAYGSYSGSTNYYGSSTSTTQTYDAAAAYKAQLEASQQIAEFSESNFRIRQSRQEGYLKRTTINPGESIRGYFNIKRKDGETLYIVLKVAGADFVFPWDVKR